MQYDNTTVKKIVYKSQEKRCRYGVKLGLFTYAHNHSQYKMIRSYEIVNQNLKYNIYRESIPKFILNSCKYRPKNAFCTFSKKYDIIFHAVQINEQKNKFLS